MSRPQFKFNLEQLLRSIGKWFITPFFALGSGLITTVATSTFPFISALAFPWLIPILVGIFIAETMVSVYLFKDSVPDTLTGIFVHNIFKDLTPIKKILLGLGIFSALAGGLALAALTFMSGTAALAGVLAFISVAVPPVGIAVLCLLAALWFFSFSILFI